MTNDSNPSELVEEVDGAEVYLIGDDEVRQLTHAMDWGVRHPKKIRLLHDLVVIRPDFESGITEGGIHVPQNVQDDQFNRGDFIKVHNQHHRGEVLAVGPGRKYELDEEGNKIACQPRALDLEVGNRVCYHRASSTGITWLDGRPAVLIHADGGDKGDAIIWKEEP